MAKFRYTAAQIYDLFPVGRLVVCCDDGPRGRVVSPLVKGEIYRVRDHYKCKDGLPGLLIEEVQATAPYLCFWPERFRPCDPDAIEPLRRAIREAMPELAGGPPRMTPSKLVPA